MRRVVLALGTAFAAMAIQSGWAAPLGDPERGVVRQTADVVPAPSWHGMNRSHARWGSRGYVHSPSRSHWRLGSRPRCHQPGASIWGLC